MIIQFVIMTALAGGCVAAVEFDEDPRVGLEQRLAERVVLHVEADGTLAAGVTAEGRDSVEFHAPSVVGGQLVVRAVDADHVLIEALELELSDFAIEKQLDTSRVRIDFVAASLQLSRHVVLAVDWNVDRVELEGAAYGELLLDWSLLGRDGTVLSLAPQRLRDVGIAVHLWLPDDGTVRATVDATADGLVKDFGEVEIHDLWLSVNARGSRDGRR